MHPISADRVCAPGLRLLRSTADASFRTGLSEWEDAGILAQVLAASQQEYLDSLKKSKDENGGRSADGAGPSTSS